MLSITALLVLPMTKAGERNRRSFFYRIDKLNVALKSVVEVGVESSGRTAAPQGFEVRLDSGVGWRDVVESLGTSGSVASRPKGVDGELEGS